MHTAILFFLFASSFDLDTNYITKHVHVKIYAMETEAGVQVSALPELKEESQYAAYKRRFDYLLLNLPVLHQPSSLEVRRQLNALYPDSASIQKAYLKKYAQDSVLVHYFEATAAPIDNPNWPKQKHFTEAELMEVSSKFFFCDKVLPDTSIQAHVCIGLNGIKEAEWKEDYTLLEAFCYEVIFTAFDQDSSQLWDTFVAQKREAIAQLRTEINSLEEYLDNVKKALFKRMESSEVLKQELLHYYRLNKSNLAFDIREQ